MDIDIWISEISPRISLLVLTNLHRMGSLLALTNMRYRVSIPHPPMGSFPSFASLAGCWLVLTYLRLNRPFSLSRISIVWCLLPLRSCCRIRVPFGTRTIRRNPWIDSAFVGVKQTLGVSLV